jgi:hypothetical protein
VRNDDENIHTNKIHSVVNSDDKNAECTCVLFDTITSQHLCEIDRE